LSAAAGAGFDLASVISREPIKVTNISKLPAGGKF
jgi:hypothetical protein